MVKISALKKLKLNALAIVPLPLLLCTDFCIISSFIAFSITGYTS
jgi:hypothetical protein